MNTTDIGIRFEIHNIGLDQTPGCFVCGGKNDLHNNIAALVRSEDDAQLVVALFEHGARYENPGRWMVKIGACNRHVPNLRGLQELTMESGTITKAMVEKATAYEHVIGAEMALTVENVAMIFASCLSLSGHIVGETTTVEGITLNATFVTSQLEDYKDAIESMLLHLPEEFHRAGGSSFLSADTDESGEQWTADHEVVEKLVLLGLAIGKLQFTMPREYWFAFPNGAPFLIVVA